MKTINDINIMLNNKKENEELLLKEFNESKKDEEFKKMVESFDLDDKVLMFAFDYFDKDKNGSIALSEIKNVFCSERDVPEEDFQKVIDEVDINHDGIIDFKEFKIMMKKILV